MSGLLVVPLAMVVFVAGAQARPSAPGTTADDVRELGRSIEQIHPNPFRSVSKQRFESEVDGLARRAPSLSRNELLVGVLRLIALLGPRNGHTGLFPGDPSHTRENHLYPLRLYDFADGLYVVDAVDTSLIRSRPSRSTERRSRRSSISSSRSCRATTTRTSAASRRTSR